MKHLSLWNPKGTFQDPIALAEGYDRFASQWYGLPALFDPINLQSHKVIDAGNPIVFEMSNKYVVKGIKQEKVIDSVVRLTLGPDGKIDKVEDRWNDKLPDGSVSEVSPTSTLANTHAAAAPLGISLGTGRVWFEPARIVPCRMVLAACGEALCGSSKLSLTTS